MSADAVTNFIEAKRSILADVKERVEGIEDIREAHIVAGDDFTELWRKIPQAEPPVAVILYTGSSFQDIPRCKYGFSVVVAVRRTITEEGSQNDCFDLLDEVIGVLDHAVYNEQVIYRVVSDKWLHYKNAGVTVYRIDFTGEDY